MNVLNIKRQEEISLSFLSLRTRNCTISPIMSVQLDPREVLAHLNSMGYRNISADILQEFMKSETLQPDTIVNVISTQKNIVLFQI